MPLDPAHEKILIEAGSLIRSSRSIDAIPLLNEFLSVEPTHLWALEERGRAKAFSGDLIGAKADFTERIRQAPNDPRGYTARAFYALDRANDFAGAIDDYSTAIALDPKYANAYFRRDRLKVQTGDLEGAISDFTIAIQFDEMGPESGLLNRGKAKHLEGDLEGALIDLTEAMRLEGEGAVFAPLFRGRVRMTAKDYHRAITDFSTAIQSFPELTNTYRLRAQARELFGDRVGAEEDRARLLRLGGQDLPAYS